MGTHSWAETCPHCGYDGMVAYEETKQYGMILFCHVCEYSFQPEEKIPAKGDIKMVKDIMAKMPSSEFAKLMEELTNNGDTLLGHLREKEREHLQHIDTKIVQTETTIARLQNRLQSLEEQKAWTARQKGIERWLGNNFESSCSLTPEFASFAKDFKKAIVDSTKSDFELINWSRGHFYVSGFLKNIISGKLVYFSVSDVRYWQDEWYNNILIRTAKGDRDYTGGCNNYTTFPNLKMMARNLSQ